MRMKFVKFYPQFGGSALYGEVLAKLMWDETPALCVRYWFNPDGDPPRKPYTLVEESRVEFVKNPPAGYVEDHGPWP